MPNQSKEKSLKQQIAEKEEKLKEVTKEHENLLEESKQLEQALRDKLPVTQENPVAVGPLEGNNYAVHIWREGCNNPHELHVVELTKIE